MDTRQYAIENRPDIQSVEQFVADYGSIRDAPTSTQMWFRGHAEDSYILAPTAGRPLRFNGQKIARLSSKVERNMLLRFRLRAYPHFNRTLSEWEAMFIGRHHGLPTRILDWSSSPLVALFFACAEAEEKAGTLWAIARFKSQMFEWTGTDAVEQPTGENWETDGRIKGPFPELDGEDDANYVKLVYPLHNSARLVAQGGIFSFHSKPEHPLEKSAQVEFKESHLDIRRMYKWNIPNVSKQKIIKMLAGLGISRRTIYPDLDGLARGTWEMSVLFNEEASLMPAQEIILD